MCVCAPLYYALRASSKENERNYPQRAFERFLIRREMNNRLPMYFGIIIQMSYSQGSCNLASGFGCVYKSAKYFVLLVKTQLHLLGNYYFVYNNEHLFFNRLNYKESDKFTY
jgi:hypothetical protein